MAFEMELARVRSESCFSSRSPINNEHPDSAMLFYAGPQNDQVYGRSDDERLVGERRALAERLTARQR